MRIARTLVALLLPLTLLGACGDDDAESDTDGSTTTLSTAPPSSDDDGDDEGTAPDRAADQALADSVVLTVADLGPGWTVSDDDDEEDDEEDEESDRALADCLDVDLDVITEDDDSVAAGASFEREESQVQSDVEVVPTEEEGVEDFDVIAGERFADCFGDLLDEELRKDAAADEDAEDVGVTYGGVDVTRLDLPDGLGDQAVGYRATIAVSANGIPFDSFADFLFFRRGRLEMTVSLFTAFDAPPVAYVASLASIMDERAAAA